MANKEWLKAFQSSNNDAIRRLCSDGEGQSVEGESFKNGHYSTLSFCGINFSNTEWDACIFDNVEFISCDFSGAFINASTLQGVKFEDCIFDDASLDGCVMQRTSFIALSQCEGMEMTDSQLKESVLTNLTLLDARLTSLTFTGGRITNIAGSAELNGVVLRNVEVENFDTSDMNVQRCTASGVAEVPAGFLLCAGKRKRV